MLSECLPEEREPVPDVTDHGLFLGERKTSFFQEAFDLRSDLLLKQASGFACDDKVIGVSNKIDS